MANAQHVYEVRPRKDWRGVDLISDSLPFDALWYSEPHVINNAIDDALGRPESAPPREDFCKN